MSARGAHRRGADDRRATGDRHHHRRRPRPVHAELIGIRAAAEPDPASVVRAGEFAVALGILTPALRTGPLVCEHQMLPFRLDVLRRLRFKDMFIDQSRQLGGFCQKASWGCARSIATLSWRRDTHRKLRPDTLMPVLRLVPSAAAELTRRGRGLGIT